MNTFFRILSQHRSSRLAMFWFLTVLMLAVPSCQENDGNPSHTYAILILLGLLIVIGGCAAAAYWDEKKAAVEAQISQLTAMQNRLEPLEKELDKRQAAIDKYEKTMAVHCKELDTFTARNGATG